MVKIDELQRLNDDGIDGMTNCKYYACPKTLDVILELHKTID